MTNSFLRSGYANTYDLTPEQREEHDREMALFRSGKITTLSFVRVEQLKREPVAEKEITDADRKEWGLTKEDIVTLKELKKNNSSVKRYATEGIMGVAFSCRKVQEANMKGESIIDKGSILTYPINDSRTSPQLRALYLAQEELMMQPEDVEPEQLSSPAKALVQDSTSIEIGAIMNLTDETLATLQAQNRAYLHKIFPELDQKS